MKMIIVTLLSSSIQGLSTIEVVEGLKEPESGRRTILRELKLLEKKGLISVKGKGKKTVWESLITLE